MFVYQFGLSGNKPFCDGLHDAVADEEESVQYSYEGDDDENPRYVGEDPLLTDD